MASPRTRARDADRSALCAALDAAFADGQLDGAEHRERTAAALQAKTIGELHGLVDDLQVRKPMPELRPAPDPRRRSRRLAVVVSVVLLGTGFAIGRATAPDSAVAAGEATDGGAAGVTPRVVGLAGLHTPEGFGHFVGDVRARLGSTLVAEATVYPEYAVVTTAVPGSPGRAQTYNYRGGLDGPSSAGTRDAGHPLVDLASFDPAVVLALLAGAPQSLNVTDPTSRYLIFDDEGTGPEVAVYVSNGFSESGYLEARPDGSIVSVHPYQPH